MSTVQEILPAMDQLTRDELRVVKLGVWLAMMTTRRCSLP